MLGSSLDLWDFFNTINTIKPESGCHLSSGHYTRGYIRAICLLTITQIVIITLIQITTAILLRKRFMKQAKQSGMATSRGQGEQEEASKKQRLENLRKIQALSRTVMVMAVCYTISWGPVMINGFIASLCYPEYCEPFRSLTPVLGVPVLINSSINIVTYAASNLHFRFALFKLLRCQRCVSRIQPQASQSTA